MSKKTIIGLDIGGTKTLAAVFDSNFNVLESHKFKTQPEKGDGPFARELSRVIHALVRATQDHKAKVAAVGIGCSGNVNFESSQLSISPHIPFLAHFPLAQKVAQWTGAKPFLGNDVQMGLYGEHQLGAARGASHAIGVFIGTGIGGALIIDGKLHRGAQGIAGDIGHYLAEPLGVIGGWERQGMLDNIASRTAIAAEAAVYAARQWAPHLRKLAGTDISAMRSKTLCRAIEQGDKRIEELIFGRARLLGIVLSNLVDFLNPDVVVLGGGLTEEMPRLICKGVTAGIKEFSTPAAARKLKIVPTKLKGYAVAAGAAKMAWDTRKRE